MAKDMYSVSLYHNGLASSLQRFTEYVWPSKSHTRKGSVEEPSGISPERRNESDRSPTFLFTKNEEVIGHIGTLPVSIRNGNCQFLAHWIVGFMVLPAFRNGLAGPCLIKKVNETLDFAMTLHVEETVKRIVTGLGWTHLGVIPQYVHVLNGRRLINQVQMRHLSFLTNHQSVWSKALLHLSMQPYIHILIGLACWMVTNAWLLAMAVTRFRTRKATVVEEDHFDDSYDQLWQRIRGFFDATVVRDRTYLETKYGRRVSPLRLLACRYNGELQGFFMLKVKQFENDPRMGNAKVGTIVDCLFDPRNGRPLQSMVAGAIDVFKAEGVDVIFCTASHRLLRMVLRRNAFFEVPGTLNFAYYNPKRLLQHDIPLDAWHIMRGDSDAAANF
jgi:hypothetical protein